ncbi:hypothetical protein D0817_21710 [Flavobacterium cupreum]|uniref:Uncharacterized protein n=1 Tax=Flavobacterium cupreum TaxID=2133766 RepID=A0A434A1X4_9FLAO|nr:hypothetical protein D0817_21710 [Flavobacterium cupreum]
MKFYSYATAIRFKGAIILNQSKNNGCERIKTTLSLLYQIAEVFYYSQLRKILYLVFNFIGIYLQTFTKIYNEKKYSTCIV